ncbi:hypothetical protein QFC20_001127 [Naganishia adeliensis]|uniref:Uncharacterized protein n=1 Tax=Naganishia adeliensis TaxID=92952 RepID=A0ACC2WVS3_9TREE|nr:hypothetical protein QFC20_001127 [Naganishia adeliensis]
MDFLKKLDFGGGAAEPIAQQALLDRSNRPPGQHDVRLLQDPEDTLQDYPVPKGLAAPYFLEPENFEPGDNFATGFEGQGNVDAEGARRRYLQSQIWLTPELCWISGQDIGFDQVLDPNKPDPVAPINTQDKFLQQSQQPNSQHSTSAFPISAFRHTELPGFADEAELAHRSYAHADELKLSSDSSSNAGSGVGSPRFSGADDDSELLVQNFRNGYRDVPEGDPDSAPDSAQLSAEEPTENDGLLDRLHNRVEDQVEEQVVKEVRERFGNFGGELVEGYLDRECGDLMDMLSEPAGSDFVPFACRIAH